MKLALETMILIVRLLFFCEWDAQAPLLSVMRYYFWAALTRLLVLEILVLVDPAELV